jgi:hypothetical protein
MDKQCPRCGGNMQLQSDGTGKCEDCGYVSSSQYALQSTQEEIK